MFGDLLQFLPFKCFRKLSIVDIIKYEYIEQDNIDESTRLIIDYLNTLKNIHPIANIHYHTLTTHTPIKSPSMIVEHDSAYEWIVKYHTHHISSKSYSRFLCPFY